MNSQIDDWLCNCTCTPALSDASSLLNGLIGVKALAPSLVNTPLSNASASEFRLLLDEKRLKLFPRQVSSSGIGRAARIADAVFAVARALENASAADIDCRGALFQAQLRNALQREFLAGSTLSSPRVARLGAVEVYQLGNAAGRSTQRARLDVDTRALHFLSPTDTDRGFLWPSNIPRISAHFSIRRNAY